MSEWAIKDEVVGLVRRTIGLVLLLVDQVSSCSLVRRHCGVPRRRDGAAAMFLLSFSQCFSNDMNVKRRERDVLLKRVDWIGEHPSIPSHEALCSMHSAFVRIIRGAKCSMTHRDPIVGIG